jgi:hypothetical protein
MNMLRREQERQLLTRTAGNVFTRANMQPGDFVFIVSVHDRNVFLIGRMRVKRIWPREEWDRHLNTPELWEGEEVVEGSLGTPMRFTRALSEDVLTSLRFTNQRCIEWELYVERGRFMAPRQLWGVHRLTDDSITVLNRVLSR